WKQVAVPGLPGDYYSFFGFRVQPDAAGGLHAWFQTGTAHSGTNRIATQQVDDSWPWTSLGSYDPNGGPVYTGKDAWDRTYALIRTHDWEDGPQLFLNFAHWDDFLVGETSDDLGRVANAPRPALG